LWEVAGIQNNIKNISHRYPKKNYAKIIMPWTMRTKNSAQRKYTTYYLCNNTATYFGYVQAISML
jgi:hypothetical protein